MNEERMEAREEERRRSGVRYSAKDVLTEVFFGTMYAIWGYLLGECTLPFGARPFGIAALAAADRRVPYLFAGLCLSTIGKVHPWMKISVYALTLLVRLLVRFTLDTPWKAEDSKKMGEKKLSELYPVLFSEHVALRMATACIAVFAMGVYTLVSGGFLYYDLYGTILATVVAPVSVLLFSGFFHGEQVSPAVRLTGFLSLSCAIIFASRGVSVYGISAAAFGAMMVTLYVTRRRGAVQGMLAGTLCGLVWSPALSPIFVFSALCGSLFFSVSTTLAVAGIFAVGVAWGVYAKGIGVLTSLVPALLASTLIFTVVDKLFLVSPDRILGDNALPSAGTADKSQTAEDTETVENAENATDAEDHAADGAMCVAMAENELDHLRLSDTNRRVKKICENFSALADIFDQMSATLQRPNESDLRRICDNAFDSSCAGCTCKNLCWNEEYDKTNLSIGNMCGVLHRNGHVDYKDVSAQLTEHCARLPDIIDEINHNAALHTQRVLQCDKTEIFAADYAAIADVMAACMMRDGEEYLPDGVMGERLAEALSARGYRDLRVAVCGARKKRVAIGGNESVLAREKDAILEIARQACGVSLTAGELLSREDGSAELILEQAQRISVSYAKRIVRAEGEEEYCGDTVGIFENSEDCFYALISDGMGSGSEAAVTSGIAAMFLQKMLTSGNPCETSLRMLNSFLRNKGSGSIHECSATVDLMELDLIAGRAFFYKSGAAPTYVMRNGGLFKLRSKTLPVGILKEPDAKKISFDVGPGDVIVMVSDGVTQGKEECPWLFDLLRSNVDSIGLDRTADLIIKYAKTVGCSDDISVLLAKIA